MEESEATDTSPFVSCRTISNTRCMMTLREVAALNSCKHEIRSSIQPVVVASALHKNGGLSESSYSIIKDMFSKEVEREKISDFLIDNIPSCMNLESFVQLLDECGYRKTACHLFLTYITGGINCIHKSTSGQRPIVHKFFRNLKRMVHDAQFENPRLALRQMANRFIDQMQNETDHMKRQVMADKCIAIIGAEIDAIAITFDKRLHEHDVFTQMKHLVTETSNTSITDVVYLGRLANANSIAGNFHDSEDILVEARCRAYNTGPCLELVNMLYIEVYVKLWEFEKFPSKELRKQLMMWGRVGLESLENEDVDTKTLWRRMFILRMVFCLIGLGNRANVIENCPIDKECLTQARDLLSDIDRTWYGIETRRKMFYFVARARLSELTENPTECIEYIRQARKLANEGHFEELIFIVEYYERIINRMRAAGRNTSSHSGNCHLLRRESDGSLNDSNDECILAATDENRNFVLLQTFADSNYSAEDRLHICTETTSSTFPVSDQPIYCPAGYDESHNLLLLKSLELSLHPGTCQNESSTETRKLGNKTHREPINESMNQLNYILLHSSQGCSASSSFRDLETSSFCQISSLELNLCHAAPEITKNEQLVLVDLQNPSNNYVLINSDTCGSSQSSFEIIACNEQDCEMLPLMSPIRRCAPTLDHIGERKDDISPPQKINTDTNQRLDLLFPESDIDSINIESAANSELIPAGAFQGVPRYYMIQDETISASDHILGERSEPSGCSSANIPNAVQTRVE